MPASTTGKDGPLNGRGLRCRGLHSCGLHSRGLHSRGLRRGLGTGQFLTADPDGGDRDEPGEQSDPRGDNERTGKPTVKACS